MQKHLEDFEDDGILASRVIATLYAPEEYQSRDIDWVTEWRVAQGAEALAELGDWCRREGAPERFETFQRRLRR